MPAIAARSRNARLVIPTMSVFIGVDAANQFQAYLHVIADESDRGAVLVAASLLDTSLEAALRKKLAPATKNEDPLFNGGYSPLRSFAAKIELAFRLGLISRETRRMLHILRDIRNDFAHGTEAVSLAGEPTKSRIRAVFDQLPEIHEAIIGTIDETLRQEPATTLESFIESDRGRRTIFDVFFAINAMALRRIELEIEPIRELNHSPLTKKPIERNGDMEGGQHTESST
jgi:hypothetical protein